MSQDFLIKLRCEKCPGTVYYTRKNKKKVERKIELKKYCPALKKHMIFKESKK